MDSWITLALPSAVAYAASLSGDAGQAEDVVQDCVCRLLDRAAHYDLPRDGRKLLFRAITNACINRHTRQRRILSLDEQGRPPGGGRWEVNDTNAIMPPHLAMASELRSAIAAALKQLPLRQRSALELSSLGYRPDEIAEMLDVRVVNVRVLLFRARKAMARFLNTHLPGDAAP
ncbi:MAG: RNA polymerase sigma factor [Pirellulales bacterium]